MLCSCFFMTMACLSNMMLPSAQSLVPITCGLCAQVLLLDEITVDMDVVGRLDLLKFFVEECETRGATIIYATHIFDGLEKWITHVAYLADGQLRIGKPPSVAVLPHRSLGSCWRSGLAAALLHESILVCHNQHSLLPMERI